VSSQPVPRRVLVTGGGGFLGSHLVERLLASGAEVHVPTRRNHGVPATLASAPPARLRVYSATDLTVAQQVHALLRASRPDAVIHLAAFGMSADNRDSSRMTSVNVLATAHLLEAAAAHGVARLVHVGSVLEHGTADTYGATKAAAAMLVSHAARTGLPVVIARPVASFGPREPLGKLLPYVITKALNGEPVELSHGTQVREYLYVADTIAALTACLTAPLAPGAIIPFGSGRPVTVTDLARMAVAATGCDVEVRVGARALAHREPPSVRVDPAPARQLLGWQPTVPLEEGLARTVEWYRTRKEHT
jgi:nucleoside-diphosphate-sugar epimerase